MEIQEAAVLQLLFDRCCRFAMDKLQDREARGDALVGVPIVVIDLRRLSLGLVMAKAGDSRELAVEAGDAELGAIVGRFLEAGLRQLGPQIAKTATDMHTSDAASFALVVPLDGGAVRVACVLVASDDPRRQANLFMSVLDERPTGPVH